MMRILIFGIILLVASCANQPVNRDGSIPLSSVDNVDIDQYLGRWYEIARLPNSFEKNCEGVTADYSWRDDGLVRVINTCRIGSRAGEKKVANGRARIVDAQTKAKLEVSFFGPFWGDYWVIDLAKDYSLAVVGEPSGRFLWVLSRKPVLNDAEMARVSAVLDRFGYKQDALYFTAQPPSPDD